MRALRGSSYAGGIMRIEYEDDEIIVVYKEAGLAVQSGRTSSRDLIGYSTLCSPVHHCILVVKKY